MLAVRHDALLNARRDNGTTEREHVQFFANKGEEWAVCKLRGLAYPDHLRYLHEWSIELDGRSGEGMNGPTHLTWPALDAWMRATGRKPSLHQVHALFRLTDIMRNPAAMDVKEAPAVDVPKKKVAPSWPKAKVAA